MTTTLPPPGAMVPLTSDDLWVTAPGAVFGRVYFRASAHPSNWNTFRSFGPVARMRFDHHPDPVGDHGPSHAISYAVPTESRIGRVDPLQTSVVETFSETRVIDPYAMEPWFALWSFATPLRLLDVTDCGWITRSGGNAAISSGPRAVCREWSRAVHSAYDVDGIYYETSSLPMARSAALFERVAPLMPSRPRLNLPLSHPGFKAALSRIADDFGMDLIP